MFSVSEGLLRLHLVQFQLLHPVAGQAQAPDRSRLIPQAADEAGPLVGGDEQISLHRIQRRQPRRKCHSHKRPFRSRTPQPAAHWLRLGDNAPLLSTPETNYHPHKAFAGPLTAEQLAGKTGWYESREIGTRPCGSKNASLLSVILCIIARSLIKNIELRRLRRESVTKINTGGIPCLF